MWESLDKLLDASTLMAVLWLLSPLIVTVGSLIAAITVETARRRVPRRRREPQARSRVRPAAQPEARPAARPR